MICWHSWQFSSKEADALWLVGWQHSCTLSCAVTCLGYKVAVPAVGTAALGLSAPTMNSTAIWIMHWTKYRTWKCPAHSEVQQHMWSMLDPTPNSNCKQMLLNFLPASITVLWKLVRINLFGIWKSKANSWDCTVWASGQFRGKQNSTTLFHPTRWGWRTALPSRRILFSISSLSSTVYATLNSELSLSVWW